jgi:hypothetical protein
MFFARVFCFAISIIPGLRSVATICAFGNRRVIASVTTPVPHAISRMRPARSMRCTKSAAYGSNRIAPR